MSDAFTWDASGVVSLVEGLQSPCARHCVVSRTNALHAKDTNNNAQHDAALMSAGLSTASACNQTASSTHNGFLSLLIFSCQKCCYSGAVTHSASARPIDSDRKQDLYTHLVIVQQPS